MLPKQILSEISPKWPNTWQDIKRFRSDKGKGSKGCRIDLTGAICLLRRLSPSRVIVNENSPIKAEKIPHPLQTKNRYSRGYAAGVDL